ncbi:MAG: hypothetical protein ACRD3D_10955 [Terriglobia bacterium]
MENHLATSEDFRAGLDADRRVERVVLPKLGKPVLMRRPSPLWFVFRGRLPQTLAVAGSKSQVARAQAPEDAHVLAQWITELLCEVMVQPRLSQSPGPGEITPDLIADEDLTFIVRWAIGEVASDGSDTSSARDLAPFRQDG